MPSSTRQWLRPSTLLASWSQSKMTRELHSLGTRLQHDARSMAYKPSTLCVQPLHRMGEQSTASGTWLRVLLALWPSRMAVSWWAEAAHASNYIYNQLPHSALRTCSKMHLGSPGLRNHLYHSPYTTGGSSHTTAASWSTHATTPR